MFFFWLVKPFSRGSWVAEESCDFGFILATMAGSVADVILIGSQSPIKGLEM